MKTIDLIPKDLTLLILNDDNSKVNNHQFLKLLIKSAKHIVLADGGINVFLKNLGVKNFDKDLYHLGDFDSTCDTIVKDCMLKFTNYKKVALENNNYNDYEKSLKFISENSSKFKDFSNLFVYGMMGSRFDHTINNLCLTLKYNEKECFQNCNIFAATEDYQVAFLRKGSYKIFAEKFHSKNHGVGVLSLLNVIDNMVTDGLKWNINKDLSLGILDVQSSSNEIVKDYVTIQSDKSFMFSLQIIHNEQ